MYIPPVYRAGHDKASALNPGLAARYVEHTTIGDPLADAAVEAVAQFGHDAAQRFIRAGMELDASVLADAPHALRVFFESIETPPSWFNPASVRAGCLAFHNDSDLFLLAFLGDVLVRGFSTMISKSFFVTGRLWDYGVRRLHRNVLHLTEIMIPGGLERHGEGWKLSVRIRLVHAQVRHMLRLSDEWDEATLGVPMSAAHVALASAGFSAQLLRAAMRLGARPNAEARASFMHIWRYTALLLGVPETILFHGEADARELYRIGCLCEPEPDIESIAMSNALISSAPLVVNVTDAAERRILVRYGYRVSRALIGHELADKLRFPCQRTTGLLAWLRWKRRMQRLLGRWSPKMGGRAQKFISLLEIPAPEIQSVSYRLPDHLFSDQSKEW